MSMLNAKDLKQVTLCMCPITETDTANKNVNPGFRNVPYEIYEYPG